MIEVAEDTLYQALSERALIDQESCWSVLKIAEAFLAKLKSDCPKTITRVLVGFSRSGQKVTLYFIPLTSVIEVNLSDPDFNAANREQEAIWEADFQANLGLYYIGNLEMSTVVASDREFSSTAEMARLFNKVAAPRESNVKFVCCYNN